jgi:hypothetical protein
MPSLSNSYRWRIRMLDSELCVMLQTKTKTNELKYQLESSFPSYQTNIECQIRKLHDLVRDKFY